MIEPPADHYWQVDLGRFDVTLELLTWPNNKSNPVRVAMESTPGTFSNEAMVEVAERMAKRMLHRLDKATALAKTLGVTVVVK